MRRTFPVCCASTEPQSAKSMAPNRIADLRLRSADFKLMPEPDPIQIPSIVLLLNPKSAIGNRKSKII
jgi:hypothetical protein